MLMGRLTCDAEWLARVRPSSFAAAAQPAPTQPSVRPHGPVVSGVPVVLVVLVGSLLLVGITTAGAAGAMQAYPFACYPTFAFDPGSSMSALVIDVVHADGREERLPPELYREPGPRGFARSRTS